MSYSIDAQILLFASDSSSPLHEASQSFLESQLSAPDILYLAWPTAMAYLRIATHPSIFAAPLTPASALQNLQTLLAHRRVRSLTETEGFLEEYQRLTGSLPVRGNLVPDAHLATLLFQHGIRTLYTHDTDFKKFGFLDARSPFGGNS